MKTQQNLFRICLFHLLYITQVYSLSANVALNQPVYQYDGNSVAAQRAVDGNTDPDDDNTCTFIETGDDSVSAWWYVDLGSVFDIQSVTVYNSNDEQKSDYLGEFNLLRSDTPPTSGSVGCNGMGIITPRGESSTLSCPVSARYIRIEKRPTSPSRRYLTLCEVVVATSKECLDLSHLNDGTVSHIGTTYTHVATYSCNEGYDLIGQSTRQCLADGSWTGLKPECRAKDCGGLSNPYDGKVSYEDTIYRSVASYSCNEGYVLFGDTERMCSADGIWTGMQPECRAKDCGTLSNPYNGIVSHSSGTTFNSIATYRCFEGFDLIGDKTRQCSSQGFWTGSEPQCKVCPPNCVCDELYHCQSCVLWYVPYGVCNALLEPGTLDVIADVDILDISHTKATIRFLQDLQNVPQGFENHYFYILLLKQRSDTLEILEDSPRVYHKVNQKYVNLIAENLTPGTLYTLKAAIYRTHRGHIHRGAGDSKEITFITLSGLIMNDVDTEAVKNGNSNQATLILAVLFGILLLAALVVVAIFVARRYYLKQANAPNDGLKGSHEGKSEQKANTQIYENVTLQSSGAVFSIPTGDIEETGYTAMSSATRSPPQEAANTERYQELILNKQ